MNFKIIASPKNAKVFNQIKRAPKSTMRGIRNGFLETRKDLVREARRLITEPPKTGRIYLQRLKGRLVRHQASAPGEAPANFTGALRSSVGAEVSSGNQMEFGAGSTSVEYARILELGGGNIAPRPYLIKSINNEEKNTRVNFDKAIEKELMKL